MKKYGKILGFYAVMFLLAANPVFSQTSTIKDLQDAVETFSEEMAKSLPFNSTIGLNWSDSYIGQFLDIPPHFGIGLSVGATTLDMDAINGLMGLFGNEIKNIRIGFPLPVYTADVRIGGFILPFDIGAKFGYLNTANINSLDFYGVDINYMLVGGDIRYALISSKIFPVKFSVGLGFNHLRGGISATISDFGQKFSFNSKTDSYTLSISDPTLGLLWQTNTLELKAQICFPLMIITPYFGAGVSYAWSKAGYRAAADIVFTKNGVLVGDIDEEIIDLLNEMGITGVNENGFESIIGVNNWNMRFFGGLSLNLSLIKFDLTGMYNFRSSSLGASAGIRFQL